MNTVKVSAKAIAKTSDVIISNLESMLLHFSPDFLGETIIGETQMKTSSAGYRGSAVNIKLDKCHEELSLGWPRQVSVCKAGRLSIQRELKSTFAKPGGVFI